MSENAKTITFVAIGLAAVALAAATRPQSAVVDVSTLVGEVLNKDFVSPSDAKRLRIVRFDEEAAALRTFEVAEEKGIWTLPSKDGYPADATAQMADAATMLMGRTILDVASESAADHVQYGVVDPLGPKLEVGQKGVGTRITVSGVQEQPLVDLIIGKEVKDSPGKHYVRRAGQSLVYVIEVEPSRLSTKFEDWIEKDLLKFTALDMRQVEIKDYSAELTAVMTAAGPQVRPTWDPRAEMTLAYDDQAAAWNPVKLRAYQTEADAYVDFTLADDEELNAEALDGLKNALADLQIVDVARKPAGMSDDLKAGEDIMNNREALQDLMLRGFTPVPVTPGGPPELISSDGEVIVTMKNGAEYVLRFGDLVQVDEEPATDDADATQTAATASNNTGVHRYLFAMARFNEAAVMKPELADLPELPAGAATVETSETSTVETPETPIETPNEEDKTPPTGEPASAGGESDESKNPPSPYIAQEEAQPEQTDTVTADETAAATADEAKQEATINEATDDTAAAQPTAEGEATGAAQQPADTDAALAQLIAERKRIETENQRKLDEYQATLAKGREQVKDLNLRFGDWYFVVGNDVFAKIRLGRDAVIKKKAAAAAATEDDGANAVNSILGPPGTTMRGLPDLLGTDVMDEKDDD